MKIRFAFRRVEYGSRSAAQILAGNCRELRKKSVQEELIEEMNAHGQKHEFLRVAHRILRLGQQVGKFAKGDDRQTVGRRFRHLCS